MLEISVVIGNYNEADALFRIVALEDLERGQSYGPMTPEELMQNEKFKGCVMCELIRRTREERANEANKESNPESNNPGE